MGRIFLPLALVVTFALGVAAGGVVRKEPSAVPEVDRLREAVSRLQEQNTTLQARLRARENLAALRQGGASSGPETRRADRFTPAGGAGERMGSGRSSRGDGAAPPPGEPPADRAAPSASSRGPVPTVQTALDRFYQYLEATNGSEGRERWQQARHLIDDLRAMGSAGVQALMQVLASGGDSDERRAAARLLGALQVAPALPLLRDIIDKEDDVLLRRAAASSLRQLQTADSVPVMERLLANPAEDRFVRLSAAYGLAQSGRPLGVTGLTHIFEESTADGRAREMTFRALNSLNDERSAPFMRALVTSQAEPSYRLRAIQYLSAHGDRQALGALHLVMQAPNEQPSIRDAATQAYAAIRGR